MKIILLGEIENGSAEYIKDNVREMGHELIHVPSSMRLPKLIFSYDVLIISDYPAKKISSSTAKLIIKNTAAGARLIMIGGWDSFNGRGNGYYGHQLEKILPVKLLKKDDRMNIAQGLLLYPNYKKYFPVKLDWKDAPIICGYNETVPRNDAEIYVYAKPIKAAKNKIFFGKPVPLVVASGYGFGRTVACMTDLTPHWCGGLVDWGKNRKRLKSVEVGDMYGKFIRLLLEI